jgi:hypothetical protein
MLEEFWARVQEKLFRLHRRVWLVSSEATMNKGLETRLH